MSIKTNVTLPELVQELELQNTAKKDYVVPSKSIAFVRGNIVFADGTIFKEFVPNEVFHQQMAEKLGIPANYYRRMQSEAPDILAMNVNGWLQKNENGSQLIRTFEHEVTGNIARSLLSDRYGAIDNYDVLFAALEAIRASGVKVVVKEASVTDKRLYVNIVAPEVEVQSEAALRGYLSNNRNIHAGYGIAAGIVITNSEVGHGSYEIKPRVLIKVCDNGMVVNDDAFRKVHLGGKLSSGQVNWSDQTKTKAKELIISQTGDAVRSFLEQGYVKGVVEKIERAAAIKLDSPIDTVQNVIKEVSSKVSLTEENKKNILNYFMSDGDISGSGISQAITREAQKVDADTRYDLELTAFEILPKIKSFDKPFVSGKN